MQPMPHQTRMQQKPDPSGCAQNKPKNGKIRENTTLPPDNRRRIRHKITQRGVRQK